MRDRRTYGRRYGTPTRDELLAPIARWGVATKAELLRGVQHGVISKEEACAAHSISTEEFMALWERWCSGLASNLRATIKARRRA